jgi:hypothetical protein
MGAIECRRSPANRLIQAKPIAGKNADEVFLF